MKKALIGLGLVVLLVLASAGMVYAAPLGQDSGPTTDAGTEDIPWIGVVLTELTPELAEHLGTVGLHGAVVVGTADGSPAQAAGLHRGDLITATNGVSVPGPEAFLDLIHAATIGQPLTLTLFRQGAELSLEVIPQAKPVDQHEDRLLYRLHQHLDGFRAHLREPAPSPLARLLNISSLDRLVSIEIVVEAEDGSLKTVRAVGGSAVSANDVSITVSPKDGSPDQEFPLNDGTILLRGRQRIHPADIGAGEHLILLTVNGDTRLVLVASLDGGFPLRT